MYYETSDSLAHYGVKGMKWGVRKKRETSGPRTQWGQNRAYAKEQDATNKAQWKSTKAKVKSGELSKKSQAYKDEKKRYNAYNSMRYTYYRGYGMTKAARGKQMKKLGISAKTPISSQKRSKVAKENLKAILKQTGKYSAIRYAGSLAAGVGAMYLVNRMNIKVNPARSLGKGDMINLKPWQYKVR